MRRRPKTYFLSDHVDDYAARFPRLLLTHESGSHRDRRAIVLHAQALDVRVRCHALGLGGAGDLLDTHAAKR